MRIEIPDLSLVVLLGVSGSGKSTFARTHFRATEVVSSDACRAMVADDETDQSATPAAFEVLHLIAAKRLQAGLLTVVDATNVQPDSRRPLVELARRCYVPPVAVVLDVPVEVCLARNASRPERHFGPHVVRNQQRALKRSIGALGREGFRRVVVLRGEREIEAATFERERRRTDFRDVSGPFDIIGDVHGCYGELVTLLTRLGYDVARDGSTARHPDGRTAVFVGDLVDRGPAVVEVVQLVMGMVRDGTARCVVGNHEDKLKRALEGRNVTVGHGLAESLAQLAARPPEVAHEVRAFIDSLVSHQVLDGGRLVVAHAGLREDMQNRPHGAVRSFCLYGDTTGETDDYGLPVRYPWADEYRGRAMVVYGHTPVPTASFVNNTICVDTGCVFGGSLTALRYPERELVSVPATAVHFEPSRPLVPAPAAVDTADGLAGDELDLADVLGRRHVQTALTGVVTINEDNARAALEVMSRFAADPRWLVYLPPTMAPPATSALEGWLEHPLEAFDEFRRDGVAEVVCEEKHMGSRAVVVLCRTPEVGTARFGITGDGVVLTRTGRAFFDDGATERDVLARLRAGMDAAELWDRFGTDWVVLDAELLPWSAKAGDLLRNQYAATGAAARTALPALGGVLAAAARRGVALDGLDARLAERGEMADRFVEAYRRYCWDVGSVDDLRLAPFQVLAVEGEVTALRPHAWHLDVLCALGAAAPGLVRATDHRFVTLDDEASVAAAVAWWTELTEAGGEGMVVKPATTVAHQPKGLVQPGIKVRGREYLRIIYGPEYTRPEHLVRLRKRALGHKRALANREFSLGIEALTRFVAGEPLRRVHECVFGVLALESEPVDPRL